jgi:hypothetical protein
LLLEIAVHSIGGADRIVDRSAIDVDAVAPGGGEKAFEEPVDVAVGSKEAVHRPIVDWRRHGFGDGQGRHRFSQKFGPMEPEGNERG